MPLRGGRRGCEQVQVGIASAKRVPVISQHVGCASLVQLAASMSIYSAGLLSIEWGPNSSRPPTSIQQTFCTLARWLQVSVYRVTPSFDVIAAGVPKL